MLGFSIRDEGQLMRPGFNFYPLSAWKDSRGGLFFWQDHLFWFRYVPRRAKGSRWVLRHDNNRPRLASML